VPFFVVKLNYLTFEYFFYSILIETLISSKTRIKLLLKFFLNSSTTSYLRSLEDEFDESSNSVRLELNRLENAGMLTSSVSRNKKWFKVNTNHPLYLDVQGIVRKYVGVDHIIDNITKNIGDLHSVYLTGDYAKGKSGNYIELVIVGDNLDSKYLKQFIQKSEQLIKKTISYTIYSYADSIANESLTDKQSFLLLWSK
jgi:hypothetical protein